jgi:hypothetical protein
MDVHILAFAAADEKELGTFAKDDMNFSAGSTSIKFRHQEYLSQGVPLTP